MKDELTKVPPQDSVFEYPAVGSEKPERDGATESLQDGRKIAISATFAANMQQDAELDRTLHEFNSTYALYPRDRLLHGLFEQQVGETPHAVAVVYDGQSHTYAQLNGLANRLAHHLVELGVRPDELVGIFLDRSVELVLGVLATWKAGGAYVPLDPSYPAERIAHMLSDSHPRVVITCGKLRELLPDVCEHVLAIDESRGLLDALSSEDMSPAGLTSKHLAYVIYTSGSTGLPKGVMVEHAAVTNLWQGLQHLYEGSGPCTRVALNASLNFDASVQQLVQLLSGRTLHLVPSPIRRDPTLLLSFLQQHSIEAIDCTPSQLNAWVQAGLLEVAQSTLRLVLVGGEPIDADLWRRLSNSSCIAFENVYGPTECTVDTTSARLNADKSGAHIGRPMPNRRVYILNEGYQTVPVGATGEIYIGGEGVARGYLNRAELTAERFLPDPFSGRPQARMYKTGDMGRWRQDGTIDYRGRNDYQVKIRGFRIELGEIESQLALHEGVREAAVLAREDVPGEKRLVAYVVSAFRTRAPGAEELRAYLKSVMPDHMVPSAFVVLEQMPLTSNGKLDRRALPAPELSAFASRQYEAPRGEIEEILSGIWQSLLGIERVGRRDNFFELGGHSLLIVQMMERLRRVDLSADVRRVFDSPTLSDLASALTRGGIEPVEVPPNLIPMGCEAITSQMLPLASLEAENIERIVQEVPGGALNIQDVYPLAPLQEGMLFHHVLNERQGDTYVLSLMMAVPSRQRLEELAAAVQMVISRHDVLRTAVLWEQLPKPVQVVYRQATLELHELVLDAHQDREAQLKEWLSPQRQRLDLRRAPLLGLQAAADPHSEQWYVLLQLHHIISDHVTLERVTAEVIALLTGRNDELHASAPYRDHVAQALAYARTRDAESFFRSRLGAVNEPTAPFGLLDVHGDGSQVEVARESLDAQLAYQVRMQARRLGVSAATLFHAAWGLVIAHTSGREEVVFGSLLLGRLQGNTGVQQMLGMFINTLPLRLQLEEVTARELVEQTQRELVELLMHEQASLAVAQRCSGISGSAPLFSALLNYRHSVPNPDAQWSSAGIEVVASQERTNYPLVLSVDDLGEGFNLTAQTDRRIDPQRITAYLRTAVHSLVSALAEAPHTLAMRLSILPESERHQLLQQFNATEAAFPRDQLIHQLVEMQVERTPTSVAVVCGEQQLTYSEINCRANRLARRLLTYGVGPGAIVGLYMERTLDLVIGLLATLKAGGAYLPLDINYPAERLAFMVNDSAPTVLLTQLHLQSSLPASDAVVIALDQVEAGTDSAADENLRVVSIQPHDTAYVIYTSGSTGAPKGVLVEHRNVLNMVHWHRDAFGIHQGSRSSCVAGIGFDAATWEIWSALCLGGTLQLASSELTGDPEKLLAWWAGLNIETSFLPTPLAEFVFSRNLHNPQLRTLLIGGDRLRYRPSSGSFDLYNNYGPTETTVLATSGRVTDDDPVLHIGRPIANARIYILDRHQQPVPLGAAGEIHIGGAVVARGYLNRPELTATRFISDPFTSDGQARLYRSGDLGRWRPDGTIEYLGRNDQQVKIRGIRVELGEIEAQLAAHPKIRDVVVIAREDVPGEKRLVAYAVPRDAANANVELWREQLKAVLPEYMVPATIIVLACLPLTPNGKLDRRALPTPEVRAGSSREYEAPHGEIEEVLAGIWQSLFGVERVGRHDDFFELGGHSILIMQLRERLRRIGLSVEVRMVFDNPRLADLAAAVTTPTGDQLEVPANSIAVGCTKITPEMLPLVELQPEHIERIVSSVPGGTANVQDIYPLAPLQEGILFHHLFDRAAGDAYVLPLALVVDSRVRLDELIAALQSVVDRHEILRTAILWENLPRAVQVVYRRAPLHVETASLVADQDLLDQVAQWVEPENQRMDLRHAPPMRLKVAADPGGQWYALLQLHHIVADHITAEIVTGEIVAHLEGRATALSNAVPYRTHVAHALTQASNHDADAFFRRKLGDVQEPTAPFGLVDVHGDGQGVKEACEEFDDDLALRVRLQARRLGVSAATLFHTAWGLVVARTSGRSDVVFGSVLLGRLHGSAGGQRVLGMFINTLPLRLQIQGVSARDLVERTQRELIELLNYEQASLAAAQRCSGMVGSAPLFSALLNYRHSIPHQESEWSNAAGIRVLGGHERTNYPIVLSVDDLGSGFKVTAHTDQRVEPQRLTAYLRTAMASLLDALEYSPRKAAAELSILPEAERSKVVDLFNAPQLSFASEQLIHQMFERQVERAPLAIALTYEGQSLTYADLNRRANQVARYLRDERVLAPDELVGVCLERGPELLVALLGVLKAGGAYVPLDINAPVDRLAYVLADAAPRIVLTHSQLMERLPQGQVGTVAIDTREIAAQPDENLDLGSDGPRPHHLAYVIYTSGSTGRPKGVMVEHRNVVRLFEATDRWFRFNDSDVWTLFHSVAFDFSVWEMWGALLYGGRLVVVLPGTVRSPQDFYRLLCEEGVTVLNQTPSSFAQLIDAQSRSTQQHSLRVVVFGGEALELHTLRPWVQRNGVEYPQLVNMYGITETTVHVTYRKLSEQDILAERASLIGRPIPDLRVYVLDQNRQPVPVGVAGEMYVGGGGVARGYLNRADLTAERFIVDPFAKEPGTSMLYKSGDLARWNFDGVLEYLGRNDDQVKIRGFRIELGEIEAQLLRHPSVKMAAVIAREDAPGAKRLVAYLIAADDHAMPTVDALRTDLRNELPEYMIPSAFVTLERFPLTVNGKLDWRALPVPEAGAYGERLYEPPQGAIEETLAAIWEELLPVERVGRQDNFFDLGGHSLLAMQAVARMCSDFSVDIPVRLLFEQPTIAQFASELDELRRSGLAAQIADGDADIEALLGTVSSMAEHEVQQWLQELKMEGTR